MKQSTELRARTFAVLAAAVVAAACSPAVRPAAATPASAATCASATVTTQAELDRLAGCRSIAGDLTIESANIESLEGLEALQTVSGALQISNNPKLEDVSALSGLRSVDSLVVANNGIYNTRGLEGLRSVDVLVVSGNSRLISLAGLDGLKRANRVEIVDNPRLALITGFLAGLEPVSGRLVIEGNSGLSRHEVRSVVDRLQASGSRVAMSR